MRYNKIIKVIKSQKISDMMGGFDTTSNVVAELKAFATPITAELALKEYGLVTTTSLKFITKDNIPTEFDYLEYENKKYKVLQLSDFNKIKVLLVEVIK